MRRRSFVGWMAALATALGIRSRAAAQNLAAPLDDPANRPDVATNATLDTALLTALGGAILPSELGADGTARAVRGFNVWIARYRGGAEVLHGYGSAEISTLPSLPAVRWSSQLRNLDQTARRDHRRGFAALSTGDRQSLVRATLDAAKLDAMPNAATADHVALALVAWFYDTPEATDLCYRAQIGKNRCRPLVNNPKEPAPLAQSTKSPPPNDSAPRHPGTSGGAA